MNVQKIKQMKFVIAVIVSCGVGLISVPEAARAADATKKIASPIEFQPKPDLQSTQANEIASPIEFQPKPNVQKDKPARIVSPIEFQKGPKD